MVNSSCLDVLADSNVDISLAGLDPRSCNQVTISGSLNVTWNVFTANADGTYTDGTTTSGTAQVKLPAGCLMISGVDHHLREDRGTLRRRIGLQRCDLHGRERGGCDCVATVNHSGGLGWVTADPQTSGNYVASGGRRAHQRQHDDLFVLCGGKSADADPDGRQPEGARDHRPAEGGTTRTGGTTGTGWHGPDRRHDRHLGDDPDRRYERDGRPGGKGGATGTGGMAGAKGTGGTPTGGTTGTGGTSATGGTTGTGGTTTASDGPCDIYSTAG